MIPLLWVADLNSINDLAGVSYHSKVNLLVELGVYYRGIYNFKNYTAIDYHTNHVFGFHSGFSLQYDLSSLMFALINFNVNIDKGDIIKGGNNNFGVEKSYGFKLGFGFKF